MQAGTLALMHAVFENAGTAPWRDVNLSYHWLDERANPIHWDGLRTPASAQPGERREIDARLRAPIPPGRYVLAVDLVDEDRCWFAEVGNHSPTRTVDVQPRDATRARAFVPHDAERTAEWDERVRTAHAEGYTAVAGAIRARSGFFRRAPSELAPYAPNGGRNPAFAHPLVCPSLLPPLEPNTEVAGLPAWRPEGDEPWLYDARIVLTLQPQSGRRRA